MPAVTDPILAQYVILTEFLGQALGPDYEVALHDMTDANHSIIAIANSHISGRKVGAPLTNMALSILRDRSYEESDYRVCDYGLSINGKELRSNTMFIKRDGNLIGMLCINFDDSRYRAMADQFMELAHPNPFLQDMVRHMNAGKPETPLNRTAPEEYNISASDMAMDAVGKELQKLGVTAEHLTAEERIKIIGALEDNGVFLLKGIVRDVAAALHCSQASVYRYLSQVKNESGS